MWYKLCLGACVLLLFIASSHGQPNGHALPREPTYFITAPSKIHPNQVVNLQVSILRMYHSHINVRAMIRRDKEELTQAQETFHHAGTIMMAMRVPDNADAGNYTLRVEGSTNDAISGYIFENDTELIFERKQCSVFIQISKPIYKQGQEVPFRIMPVETNLMSRSGSMDVYAVDPTDTIVRRWLSMQTNAGGVLDLTLKLSEQPTYGTWKIQARAFGSTYEKSFEVNEFWVTAIDVNVSMPINLMEDHYGVMGVISANLSLGQPVKGTVKSKLEIRIPEKLRKANQSYVLATIERPTTYFDGVQGFMFTMQEIAEALGKRPAEHEIYVEAEVYDWFYVQSATGSGIAVIHSNQVNLILLGSKSRVFKPDMPNHIYMAVEHRDHTPLQRHRRQVIFQRMETLASGSTIPHGEEKVLVRSDSIAHYQFFAHPDASKILVTAYYDKEQTRTQEIYFARHYSPTNSYLYVETTTEKPEVDKYMIFTVRTNTFVEAISYVITASGHLVTGSSMEMKARQVTFSISVSRDMMPEARIVVWHIYEGEVIADSLNFFVNGSNVSPVNVTFNRGKDFTGDTVEITGWTDPSSYIGYSGVDYELWAYGGNPFITDAEIIREMSTYDYHANKSYRHLWKLPEEQEQFVHFPAATYGVDANKTFEYAGLVVFTDANMTRLQHPCNETMGYFPCMTEAQCFTLDQWCDGVWTCWDGQDEMGCDYGIDEDIYTPAFKRLSYVTRHYNELGDWLWRGHFVKPDGRLDLRLSAPDEPMSWVASAFTISRNYGFGIYHEPARHQATRMFYMRAEAPGVAKKGEQIGIRLGLFNYWDQDLECLVLLRDSDDYRFVVVEEFGIVSSYAPRTIRGDIQTMIWLEMGYVYEMHIPIIPIKDGCISVTVTAHTFIYGDSETLEICTKYDGVTNYLNTPFLIDLVSQGSMVLPDLEIPVPERFIKPQQREHLYVPGSPEATVGIVGDVVGPGFYQDYLDAETLINKPFGSAEQNMFNFATNLYNLKYLKVTNQLDNSVLEKALDGMNLALQRQMGYMNSDGSFSMFRDYQEYTPSVWGTAFVLRVLNYANDKDWEYDFFIPVELLNKIMLWLCRQRDTTTGAFYNRGPIYDRKMWENTTMINGTEVPNNISITAYVLIALSESVRVTGQAEHCKTQAQQKAVEYLEPWVQNLTDPFQTCMVTYALYRAGSIKATEAFQKMESMKRVGEYVYWAAKEVPANRIKMIDNYPYHQPRDWYDNEGSAVQGTGYGLLTYMQRYYLQDSVPIMKWLNTMRNTYAGFASSQDSTVALEALTEYAKQDTNRALYNIRVETQITSIGNSSRRISMARANWPNLQEISIPDGKVWGSVRGRAEGTGIALMQLHTKVNVEYPNQIQPLPPEGVRYFSVEINPMVMSGKNFSIINMTACARWLRPDLSERSGMAVLELDTPTGYRVTNDVLRTYAQSGKVPTLRRAEETEEMKSRASRKVAFYFDYLEYSKKTCVNIRLDRWFPVANMTIQHRLRVYDYYEPGMHNTTIYETWALNGLHICQVCGSFQCPYCPFYNMATTVQASVVFSIITTAIALLTSRRFLVT